MTPLYVSRILSGLPCRSGGIGRRARVRAQSPIRGWGFESPLRHQTRPRTPIGYEHHVNRVTRHTPRGISGCIITLDSPVLPILPGRVLLLGKSARRLRLVSTLQPSASACQLVPLRPCLAAHDKPLPVAVGFHAHGGEVVGPLAEILTRRRSRRADKSPKATC